MGAEWMEAVLTLDGWRLRDGRRRPAGKRLAVKEPVRWTYWIVPWWHGTHAHAWTRDAAGRWALLREGGLADVLRAVTWRCACVEPDPVPRMSAWGWLELERRVVEVTALDGHGGRQWWGLAELSPLVQAVVWEWVSGCAEAAPPLWDLLADLPPGRPVCTSDPTPPPRTARGVARSPYGPVDSPRWPWRTWAVQYEAALVVARQEAACGG